MCLGVEENDFSEGFLALFIFGVKSLDIVEVVSEELFSFLL
jgi:hypothetical protein